MAVLTRAAKSTLTKRKKRLLTRSRRRHLAYLAKQELIQERKLTHQSTQRAVRFINRTLRIEPNRPIVLWIGHGDSYENQQHHMEGSSAQHLSNRLDLSIDLCPRARPDIIGDAVEIMKGLPEKSINGLILCYAPIYKSIYFVERLKHCTKSGAFVSFVAWRRKDSRAECHKMNLHTKLVEAGMSDIVLE